MRSDARDYRPERKEQRQEKLKQKLPIPQGTGVNYIGLIIGPKGSNLKRMEEESGCKIVIRENEEPHVLLIADTED
jgi:hypothetical protein